MDATVKILRPVRTPPAPKRIRSGRTSTAANHPKYRDDILTWTIGESTTTTSSSAPLATAPFGHKQLDELLSLMDEEKLEKKRRRRQQSYEEEQRRRELVAAGGICDDDDDMCFDSWL